MADDGSKRKEDKPFSVVTLDNIAGGALREQFDSAWDELIANIRDPNTEAEKTRGISIQIKVLPDQTRGRFKVLVKVTTKLEGLSPATDQLYLGRDEEGRIRPFTFDQKQSDLFRDDEKEDVADVLPMNHPNATGAR